MTALLALLLVLAVCGGIPGAYLLGKRIGRHIQTKQVFNSGYELGAFYAVRRVDNAMRRVSGEGP